MHTIDTPFGHPVRRTEVDATPAAYRYPGSPPEVTREGPPRHSYTGRSPLQFQAEIASRFRPQIDPQIGIEIAHPTHPRAPATPSASGPPDRERDSPPPLTTPG